MLQHQGETIDHLANAASIVQPFPQPVSVFHRRPAVDYALSGKPEERQAQDVAAVPRVLAVVRASLGAAAPGSGSDEEFELE